MRGGGGNFGVVTAFEYRLYPVSQMLGGLLIYPMAHAKASSGSIATSRGQPLRPWARSATWLRLPDGTPAAVILLAYNGSVEDGERLLRPLRECAPLLADQVGPLPYIALQSIVENFNPPGLRNYWKSNYLRDLSDGAIDVLVDHYATVPAPHTHVVIEHLGGAVSRVGEDDDGGRSPGGALQLSHCRDVDRRGRGCAGDRLGAGALGGAPTVLVRWPVCQLRGGARYGPSPGGLQPGTNMRGWRP